MELTKHIKLIVHMEMNILETKRHEMKICLPKMLQIYYYYRWCERNENSSSFEHGTVIFSLEMKTHRETHAPEYSFDLL